MTLQNPDQGGRWLDCLRSHAVPSRVIRGPAQLQPADANARPADRFVGLALIGQPARTALILLLPIEAPMRAQKKTISKPLNATCYRYRHIKHSTTIHQLQMPARSLGLFQPHLGVVRLKTASSSA